MKLNNLMLVVIMLGLFALLYLWVTPISQGGT